MVPLVAKIVVPLGGRGIGVRGVGGRRRDLRHRRVREAAPLRRMSKYVNNFRWCSQSFFTQKPDRRHWQKSLQVTTLFSNVVNLSSPYRNHDYDYASCIYAKCIFLKRQTKKNAEQKRKGACIVCCQLHPELKRDKKLQRPGHWDTELQEHCLIAQTNPSKDNAFVEFH